MTIRKALESVSRWLARKGPREQASASAGGSGGSTAEPEPSLREDLRQILVIFLVLSVCGPNGVLIQLNDKRAKEAKEAEEAKDLPN